MDVRLFLQCWYCRCSFEGLFGSRQLTGQAAISAPGDENQTPGSAAWPRQLCRGLNQTAPECVCFFIFIFSSRLALCGVCARSCVRFCQIAEILMTYLSLLGKIFSGNFLANNFWEKSVSTPTPKLTGDFTRFFLTL